MPLYAFRCSSCGDFELGRPAAEAAAPGLCPLCGSEGVRVFSAPALRRSTSAQREAASREERSRHEPARASSPEGRPLPHRHAPSRPWAVGH